MNEYKEFTFGWLVLLGLVPAQIVITYLYLNNMGDKPINTVGFVLFTLLFIITYLLFYGLTTKVGDGFLTVSFGIGLIRKRIQLHRIKKVKTVVNPWYFGWGIRFIPNGMLYNMSGSDGVELQFSDTDRIIRIGTRDAGHLKTEIENRLTERRVD